MTIDQDLFADNPFDEREECCECGGTGEVCDDHELERTCPECGGSGYIDSPEADPDE